MEPPCLPQHDPHASLRRDELVRARDAYRYDRSYEDILYCESVPLRDKSDPRYWMGLGRLGLEVQANRALTTRPADVVHEVRARMESALEGLGPDTAGRFAERLRNLFEAPSEGRVHALGDFDRAYRVLPAPLPQQDARWRRDEVFAWQALAGCNPVMIRRLRASSPKLPLSPARFAEIVRGDRYERALAEGRLYLADYEALEGLPGGETDGLPKHSWAPVALYCWTQAQDGRPAGLMPVAIQCGQVPGASRIFTPGDGTSWMMARLTVAVADSQVQGLMEHFGRCHLVMEAVALAMHRQLAGTHPLRRLLEAHVECTLIANDICRSSLTNPGGIVDRLQAFPLPVSMALCNRAVESFRIMDSAPAEDFGVRGVDDAEALPEYPFRDDQLAVWWPIQKFVDGYVRLYYSSDADVTADAELAGFVRELGAERMGRLRGIGAVETVERLSALLTRVVFRASAYHAAINYSLYDFTYAPNGPTSAFGPGPSGDDTDADWLRMFPPYDIAYEVIGIYYPLQLRLNRLGDYGARLSADPRVAPLEERLRSALRAVDASIDERNALRLVPYVYSQPSQITQSIHV